MNTIKLIAINIDGVLLEDTFSPIIYNFVTKYGIKYTQEIEKNIFSRPQKEAAEFAIKIFGETIDIDHLIKSYFFEREKYLKIHGCRVNEGVPEFIKLVSTLNVNLVYYGGLQEEKIVDDFKEYKDYFERYICTNDFRPGIKEITKDIYGFEYNQVLFIDDVNTVAEVAKANNVPFIGIPSKFPWGFQRQDMIKTKVRYLLSSIKEINIDLLEKIDYEALNGVIWGK
ncbi:MAG: HAD family hydrolase [Firmicutes bacterium]|mgnify:CR=1 FL=1|nr:HAD family hydrolase [Bacillota bacterium]